MGQEISNKLKWKQPLSVSHVEFDEFVKIHKPMVVVDSRKYAFDELYDIHFPSKKDTKTKKEVAEFTSKNIDGQAEGWGKWFYLHWINYLVYFPPEKEHRLLRTSRNNNLILASEQEKLYKATILVAGMSVGSNVVEAMVSQGIGGKFILADMDIIEPTNLNRIRAPYHDVGVHKIDSIAKKVSEIDPYIDQIHLRDGLNKENLEEVIALHKPDIIVDEIDSLEMKVIIREAAKNHKLPVLMATDNGDDFILDIERYDTEEINLFNARIPREIIDRILGGEKIPRAELGRVIGEHFVGEEYISERMMESLHEVGKTIPSWPQLGSSAAMGAIYVATFARYILLGRGIKSQRIHQGPNIKL